MGHAFTWMGMPLVACASGALWWPAARLLCVADLHLGRSERLARRGGALLPPYETGETLARLEEEVARREPATVVCLGDSFDDGACAEGLAGAERARILKLVASRDWVWIAGNHDPGPVGLGGRQAAALPLGGLLFRHEPAAQAAPGEVAGHLHPKVRLALGGRAISRRCFVLDELRMILPAFGAYTGGLPADHPALAALFEPGTARVILAGQPCLTLPLAAPGQRRLRA